MSTNPTVIAASLQAWELRIHGQFADFFVAPTAGKAKAELQRDYGSPLRFTAISAKLYRCPHATELIEAFEDVGKYWRDTRAFARTQAKADTFNANWPVGTPVQVVNCCEAEHWPEGITVTRTPAWAASEKTALVSLEGYAGGFYLKNVVPLVEPLDA